eukprot:scaffold4390_cov108-Isochrysis_galbana.AAC.1
MYAEGGGGQNSRRKRFQIFWKGPFECGNELLQGRFEPPKRIVVDSRSCGSKGGGCNTQKSLCSTLFPCQERQALAIGPGKCQQCQPVRTMPGQEVPQALAQARNRTCIELVSALEGWARSEPGSEFMSTSIGGRVSCRGAIVRTTACAEFCLFTQHAGTSRIAG